MTVLPLIERLFLGLQKKGLRFCVWKSSTFLDRTLQGAGDLDLLIEAGSFRSCRACLQAVGFIEGKGGRDGRLAGVWHFFGFDDTAGKIVHVHLQDRLLAGDVHLPNYHLDVEDLYLRHPRFEGNVPLPEYETEYIVLVIRLTLKYQLFPSLLRCLASPSRWSLLPDLLAGRPLLLSATERAKLEDLQRRSAAERVESLLATRFPWLKAALFRACVATFDPGTAPRYAAVKTARRLARALAGRRLNAPPVYCGRLAAMVVRQTGQRLLARLGRPVRLRRMPDAGGRLIAFVGVDGSGKSTAIGVAHAFLQPFFDVRRLHFGKPRRGVLWYLSHGVLKAVRTLCRGRADDELCAIRLYFLARGRHRVFVKARRLARKGFCVFLDRFPLRELRTMDSPRIRFLSKRNALIAWLARKEEALYRQLHADALIFLRVDLATAMARRPEDDPEALARRAQEVEQAVAYEQRVQVIDGDRALPEVGAQVCRTVWQTVAARPLTIEIIGPPGVGKSTLAFYLEQCFDGLETAIPFEQIKSRGQRIFMARLPGILGLLVRGTRWQRIRELILAEAMLGILRDWRRGRSDRVRPAVLHVGPIFYLAKFEKQGGPVGSGWFVRLNRAVEEVLDGVVWLDAADEVLDQRIQKRGKSHVMQGRSMAEVAAFCEGYRAAYARILERMDGDLLLACEDTGRKPVERSAAAVVAILRSRADLTGAGGAVYWDRSSTAPAVRRGFDTEAGGA